nr:MAG TPA: hypothetical protein [Bacteriophage sp.]
MLHLWNMCITMIHNPIIITENKACAHSHKALYL